MAGGVPSACGRIIGAGAFAYGAVGFLGFVIRLVLGRQGGLGEELELGKWRKFVLE